MNQYQIIEITYGSEQYKQTLALRDKVMRKPLGRSIENDDLSYEEQAIVLGAFDGEKLLGTGIVMFKDEVTAKLRFLCVDPELQKGGVGRAILEEVEKQSIKKGMKKLCLESRETARDFYKKMGYKEYGETYLLEQAPIPHIWMEKTL